MFGAYRVDLKNTDGLDVRVNLLTLREIGLAFGATSCELATDLVAADFIRLQIALKGRATTDVLGSTTDQRTAVCDYAFRCRVADGLPCGT